MLVPARLIPAAIALGPLAAPGHETQAQADVRFELAELEKACGHIFGPKDIDWKAVSRRIEKEAAAARTDSEELVLRARPLARLEDGHAEVRPIGAAKDVRLPDEPSAPGPARSGAGAA